MPSMDLKYRQELIRYGIVMGMLCVLFGLMVLFILVSRPSWRNGLRAEVEQVLEMSDPGEFIVGDFELLSSPVSTSCAAYSIQSKSTGESLHAVIARVTTLYGPVPAVFVCGNESGLAVFKGFADLHGVSVRHVEDNSRASQIYYWQRKIPVMLSKVNKK